MIATISANLTSAKVYLYGCIDEIGNTSIRHVYLCVGVKMYTRVNLFVLPRRITVSSSASKLFFKEPKVNLPYHIRFSFSVLCILP